MGERQRWRGGKVDERYKGLKDSEENKRRESGG